MQKISQRQFNSLYSKQATTLPKYAGKTVLSVLVYCEIVSRKPDHVLRIDTQKIRFDDNGALDEDYENEGARLVAAKMNSIFSDVFTDITGEEPGSKVKAPESVIDANERFNERRWNQRHPVLSGPVLKIIMEKIFGTA